MPKPLPTRRIDDVVPALVPAVFWRLNWQTIAVDAGLARSVERENDTAPPEARTNVSALPLTATELPAPLAPNASKRELSWDTLPVPIP